MSSVAQPERFPGQHTEALVTSNVPEDSYPSAETVPGLTLTELRSQPMVLDQSYATVATEICDTLQPGFYERGELVELISDDAARSSLRERLKIASGLLSNDRIVELQNGYYLEPATHSQAEKELLVSTRVAHLVDCLQAVSIYNKDLKLGDCFVIAHRLGILQSDEPDEAFKRLFVNHVRIRVEGDDRAVHTISPEQQRPSTVGEAIDQLARIHKTSVLSERMLIDHSAHFVAIDGPTQTALVNALALDERFTKIGRTSSGNLYKLQGPIDPDNVEQLQHIAEQHIDLIKARGGRQVVNLKTLWQTVARQENILPKTRQRQEKIFRLLAEAHPDVQLLHSPEGEHYQFVVTSPGSLEQSASEVPLPATLATDDTVAGEQPPQSQLTKSEKPTTPLSLEEIRQTVVEYDTTFADLVAEKLPSLKPGIYDMTHLASVLSETANLSRAHHRQLKAALRLHDRVTVLQTRIQSATECYVMQENDATLAAVEAFIDHLDEAHETYPSRMNLTTVFAVAKRTRYMPATPEAAETFKYLFKRHPRIEIHGVVLGSIAPNTHHPETIGEALDRYVTSTWGGRPLSALRHCDVIFQGCSLSSRSQDAFTLALKLDPRFAPIQTPQGQGYRIVRKPADNPTKAPARPTVPVGSHESQEQRKNRLTNIAQKLIAQVIDTETITMPTAHLLQEAAASSAVSLTLKDEEIILSFISERSRLQRTIHGSMDMFVEKSVPEKYQYDERDAGIQQAEDTHQPGRIGGHPRRMPRRHRKTGPLIDLNNVPAIEYRRIQRIEQLLALYDKQRAERIELERLAGRDTKNGRNENRRRKQQDTTSERDTPLAIQ